MYTNIDTNHALVSGSWRILVYLSPSTWC